MSPTPRHHAAPLGLAGVLFGFTCYKHVAPTELASWVGPAGQVATALCAMLLLPRNPSGIGLTSAAWSLDISGRALS